jgi:hypothetical protein
MDHEPTMNEHLRWEQTGWWCPICCLIVGVEPATVPLDHRCENYSHGHYVPTPEELVGESHAYCYQRQDVMALRPVEEP